MQRTTDVTVSTNTSPATAASRPTNVELFIAGEPTLGILMRQCKTSAVPREMKRDLFSRPYRRRHARQGGHHAAQGGALGTFVLRRIMDGRHVEALG